MKKKTIWISAAVAAALVLGGTGVAVAVTDPFDGDDTLTGSAMEKASAAALAEVGEGTVTDAEADDEGTGAYEVEVTLKNGEEINVHLDKAFDVVAVENENRSGRDDDGRTDDTTDASDDAATPLTDAEKASAEKAALAEVAGTVTDIDRSDDADHAFEVEVTKADGTDVDVELDEKFTVVRVDDDSEKADSAK